MSASNLPIFRKSRELLQHTILCVKDFPRDYRETFGKLMIDYAIKSFTLICETNPLNYSGKIEKLGEAEIAVKTLDNYFHAAFDIRIMMGIKRKSQAMELVSTLLDDIKKWKRYNENALSKNRN